MESNDRDEGLIDEDPEQLEPDRSPEATLEAGLTEEGVELAPAEDVEFEEDDEDEEG